MDSKASSSEAESEKPVAVDWTGDEWFLVWLQLTRRDPEGDIRTPSLPPYAG